MVLKLAFTQKLPYDKKHGFRTTPKAQPFAALEQICDGKLEMMDINREFSNQIVDVLRDWEVCLKDAPLDNTPEP